MEEKVMKEKLMEWKAVFEKLFDFSFSHFVAVDVAKLLYVLGLIGAGLVSLFVVLVGFRIGLLAGFGALLVLGPTVFLTLTLLARLSVEMVLVLFRIAENIQLIVDEATGSEGARKAAGS